MNNTLEASKWVKSSGGYITLRSALPDEHPGSWPSIWKDKFGEDMPLSARREAEVLDPERCPTCYQEIK